MNAILTINILGMQSRAILFAVLVLFAGVSVALNDNSFLTKLGQAQRFRSPWTYTPPPMYQPPAVNPNAWAVDHKKQYGL